MLRRLWYWFTHERCMDCMQVKVPLEGPWYAKRRVCVYCRDCAPEYYP